MEPLLVYKELSTSEKLVEKSASYKRSLEKAREKETNLENLDDSAKGSIWPQEKGSLQKL